MADTKTPLMNLDVINPVSSDSELEIWNKIIANFSALDSHTHTTGDGSPITVGALNIDTNLSFNANSATSLKSTVFNSQTVALSDLNSLFVVAGELNYRDASNNLVPITSGGSVVGAPGQISGLSAPADVNYNDTTNIITFFRDSGVYMKTANADIALHPFSGVNQPNAINLIAPTGLSASYSVTFPEASPADNDYFPLANSAGTLAWQPGFKRSLSATANQLSYVGSNNILEGLTINNEEIVLGTAGTPVSGKITNAYVDNAAAIAGTKINPDFGSQGITTTGSVTGNTFSSTGLATLESLTVTNTATFNGSVSLADGSETFTVAPPSTFSGNVTVSGVSTLNGNVSIAGGIFNISSADVNFTGASVSVSNDFSVTGNVDSSLLPKTTNVNDLGTNARRWRQIRATDYSGIPNSFTGGAANIIRANSPDNLLMSAIGSTERSGVFSGHIAMVDAFTENTRYLWFYNNTLRFGSAAEVGTSGGTAV